MLFCTLLRMAPCCFVHCSEWRHAVLYTAQNDAMLFCTLLRMAPCCFVHCSEWRRAVLYTAQNGAMLLRITGIIIIHFHLTERLLCCLRSTEISYSLLGTTRARAVGFLYLRSLTPNILDASKKKKKKKYQQKNKYSDDGELASAARLVYFALI